MACLAPSRFRVFCPSGHTQPLSGPPRPRGTHTHLSTTRSTGRQGEGAQGTRGDTANPVGPDQEHQDQSTGVQEERRQVGGWHWVWGGDQWWIPTSDPQVHACFLPLSAHRCAPAPNRPKDSQRNVPFPEYIAERNAERNADTLAHSCLH